jgi:hypothetical protein
MQRQANLIKLAYHFLSEGLIVFLLVVPMLHYAHSPIAYWIYLVILSVICVVFSILARFTTGYIWYILTAPFMFALYFLSSFSLLFSAGFAVILTWRYMHLRLEDFLEMEMHYVALVSLLAVFLVLFFNEWEPVVYLGLQFIILITGQLFRHVVAIEPVNRRAFLKQISWLIGALVCGAGLVLFILGKIGIPLFLFIRETVMVKAWDVLAHGMAVIATTPFYLWNLLNLDIQFPEGAPPNQPSAPQEMEQPPSNAADASMAENSTPFILWALVIVAAGIILFFALRAVKNSFRTAAVDSSSLSVQHVAHKKQAKEHLMKRLRERIFQQPHHPVRKLIYQFEKKAARVGKGRQHSETLEEWFQRIGLPVDGLVYEKVRYGHGNSNEQEVQQLKDELQGWDKNR